MKFVAVALVLALSIGGLVAYVVRHSETGPWWRKWWYLVGLSLIAGAVLTKWSGGA